MNYEKQYKDLRDQLHTLEVNKQEIDDCMIKAVGTTSQLSMLGKASWETLIERLTELKYKHERKR